MVKVSDFFFLLQIGAVAEYHICGQEVSHLNFICYVGNTIYS